FDIDRPLTPDEIKEVIDYCIHDVKQTIEVFDNKKEEFESQLALIEAFNLKMSMFTKTKAQLSAFILGAEKHENRGDEFALRFPDTLKVEKYKHIVDWYKEPENLDYKKKLKVDVAGVPHIFAWGGLHGAISKHKDEGIILCCDVASLYPSIMIEYGYISRNVRDPLKYTEIRDTRLELKRKKDPKQAPYKIVLNSTYGAMKDQYNPLYDPLMANNVCLAGQLLLLDLIEKIEPYCKLIQSNTDGLFMKVEKEADINIIKEVAKEWENRTRLTLEWDVYEKIYQKDVNNYIIIDGNQNYKSKGAYVKKLNN
ncbi:DNA polymerase domain-containing protein, partial [Bacillus haynesii]|nr:DNA polymerase domain-containing protein [Bacillus haynesii]